MTAHGRIETYSAGLTLTGLELGYSYWALERLAVHLRIAGYYHLPQTFPGQGELTGYSLGGGVGAVISMLDRQIRGHLFVSLDMDVLAAVLTAQPDTAVSNDALRAVPITGVALQPGWQVSPHVALEGSLGLRLVLRGPRVTDAANNELSGLNGLAIVGRVGVRVSMDGAFW